MTELAQKCKRMLIFQYKTLKRFISLKNGLFLFFSFGENLENLDFSVQLGVSFSFNVLCLPHFLIFCSFEVFLFKSKFMTLFVIVISFFVSGLYHPISDICSLSLSLSPTHTYIKLSYTKSHLNTILPSTLSLHPFEVHVFDP